MPEPGVNGELWLGEAQIASREIRQSSSAYYARRDVRSLFFSFICIKSRDSSCRSDDLPLLSPLLESRDCRWNFVSWNFRRLFRNKVLIPFIEHCRYTLKRICFFFDSSVRNVFPDSSLSSEYSNVTLQALFVDVFHRVSSRKNRFHGLAKKSEKRQ